MLCSFYSVSCHFKVDKEATQCTNKNCTGLEFSMELHYNLFISLSDHTGQVTGMRLQGQPACDLLKCTVSNYSAFNHTQWHVNLIVFGVMCPFLM